MRLLITLVLWTAICGFYFYRNHAVYKRRQKLLASISAHAHADINAGLYPGDRRYQEFDTVGYDKMLLRCWRRLDSWYTEFDWWVP